MIQPFTTLHLDPQQIIRGKQGIQSLSYMPPHCLVYSKEFALVLEDHLLPCSWFPPVQVLLLSAALMGVGGVLQGLGAPSHGAAPAGPAAQGHSAGEGAFLGHGSCTWKGNQNSSWQPGLVHRKGGGGHSPLSAPTGDPSVEACTAGASLIKSAKRLLWWDVWVTRRFWVPPGQRCPASCLVISSTALILLCYFSCPYLNQNYHY